MIESVFTANDNQVENEHFLLKCPKFLNERVIIIYDNVSNISEAISSTMNLDIPN